MDFALELDGPHDRGRIETYDTLTQRPWHPFNEWIFTPALRGSEHSIDDTARAALFRHTATQAGSGIAPEAIIALRDRSPALVDAFVDRIADYDIVGISTTFYQNVPALALARAVKRRFPEKVVILGGANTDGPMGRGLMRLFRHIDFAFVGETSRGLVDLLDGLAHPDRYSSIPGLVFRRSDGTIGEGPMAAPEQRLDDLPLPDFDDYVETWRALGYGTHRKLVLNMETSRGCWWGAKNHCTFCGLNANGMGYRAKSPARVEKELLYLSARYSPRSLFMTDNILSMDYFDTVLEFMQAKALGIDFFYEVKSNLSRQQIRKLAQAGVSSVQPGIESFSTSVLKTMRKGVTAAQNVAFLKYAREYGISPSYNIIVDFPGEEIEAYDRFLRQLPRLVHLQPPSSIPFVEFHRFSPYHNQPESFGLKLVPAPAYRVLYPEVDDEALADIAYYFIRSDIDAGTLPAYFDRLCETVFDWINRFDDKRASLTFRPVNQGIEIYDARMASGDSGGSGGAIRRLILSGAATEIHALLDRPQSIASLVRQVAALEEADLGTDVRAGENYSNLLSAWLAGGSMPIAFDRRTFLAEPEACLSLLDEAGLVFVDENPGASPLYLALAVPDTAPAVSREWMHAQV